MVDLGVALHMWDSRGHLGLAVKLDFDRDVAPLVRSTLRLCQVFVKTLAAGSWLTWVCLTTTSATCSAGTRSCWRRSYRTSPPGDGTFENVE